MSYTFTKLFSSITESTVWQESDRTRIVWITMLAMADKHGRVWGSVPGLAARAVVPIADCERALQVFFAPDPYSRTKDFDGRRIQEIEGGWLLLNHAKHRKLQDEEAQRANDAARAARYRAKRKPVTESVTESVTDNHAASRRVTANHPIAEAEADTDKKQKIKEYAQSPSGLSASAPPIALFPCAGSPGEWPLSREKMREWQESFPGVDVPAQLRAAKQWLLDNPTRQKTCRGMPAFLGRWLASEQNRGGGGGNGKTGSDRVGVGGAAARLNRNLETYRRVMAASGDYTVGSNAGGVDGLLPTPGVGGVDAAAIPGGVSADGGGAWLDFAAGGVVERSPAAGAGGVFSAPERDRGGAHGDC
jgi:hypothetical protein